MRNLMRERWERYQQELKACRRKFSTESVYESRVAARRLRAALELLATAANVDDLGKARRVLKQHLNIFATLRDAQVQRSLLPTLRLPRVVREAYDEFLRRREQKGTRRAKRGLAEIQIRSVAKAVRRLDLALRQRTQAIGEAELRAVVGACFCRVSERCSQVDAARPETIHATRVAFKRFR